MPSALCLHGVCCSSNLVFFVVTWFVCGLVSALLKHCKGPFQHPLPACPPACLPACLPVGLVLPPGSLYDTLGVPQDASDRDIKRAYRQKALKLHPDVNKAPDAEQQFLEVKAAFQACWLRM